MDKNHSGYQEALKRIDTVKRSMGTENEIFELDLSELRLFEIPKQVGQLFHLKQLNLSGNQIEIIENLESLTVLKELDLENNQIKEIKNLKTLKELTLLNLGANFIKEIKELLTQ